MELTVKKVNVRLLEKGICPRCNREVTHIVERFRGGWADVFRCLGGHLFVRPIVLIKDNKRSNL